MVQQGEYLPLAYMEPNRLSIILPPRLSNQAVSDQMPRFKSQTDNGMIYSVDRNGLRIGTTGLE